MLKNRRILNLLVLLFTSFYTIAQWYGRPGDWKKYRQEVFIMMGSSHFLGDLGGRDRKGTDFSPVDLDFNMTRTAFGAGYRYQYRKWINFAGTFNWSILKGDDASTQDIYRNNRNLNFKNNVLELTPRVEIGYFETRLRNRYTIKRSLSQKKLKVNWSYFAYTGVSVFYHNPKGKDASGAYVKLYPLHTEGQGLPGGPK
ncbi:MAG: hypothetical protein KDD29_10920, partial [Flavobacteriales bacterium]|nr:hypothetical protein [Flavobacteriales bacterium]